MEGRLPDSYFAPKIGVETSYYLIYIVLKVYVVIIFKRKKANSPKSDIEIASIL